ncbi:hypothetical protein [Streptomyces sp. WM6378]|uniref:hypothetical protein n=1 Tax=Streptomyces sp. WM6378 TaxID=1415557 RepID=UPI0006AFC088|nr:hypothetical protein [Streptomyces sp. WM6378]KOU43229.1 hypothetical protein ADK54_18145 [Streptomyces sp. WM6378]
MPITTLKEARQAAKALSERGPIAAFAAGCGIPGCFARLRLALSGMRRESLATSAALNMADGPDDPYMERGKQEMAEITSSISDLLSWTEQQLCQVEECDCRADRLLRQLLQDAQVPEQTGYSASLGRNNCVIAGHYEPEPDEHTAYVIIEHRNNIEHAVRIHHGWRARLVTAAGVTTLYASPGYPQTPVSVFREDTRACVRAVVGALHHADATSAAQSS